MRQYGLFTAREYGPPPRALTFAVTELLVTPVGPVPSSGSLARTSHASATLRPVLVPPCTVSPFSSRAFTEKSTPCQFSVWSPKFLYDCASSSTGPTATRLYRPLIVWPPPPGRRGSLGAWMPNGV